MAANVDSLMLALGLDTSKLEEGLTQSQAMLAAYVNAINENVKEGGDSLKHVGEAVQEVEAAVSQAGEAIADAASTHNIYGEKVAEVGDEAQAAAPKIEKTAQSIEKVGDSARAAVPSLNQIIQKLTQMAAPFLGGLGLNALIQQFTGATDSFGRMAKTFGADPVEIQMWMDALGDAGYNADMFRMTMRRLSRQVIGTGKTVTDVLTELSQKSGADFDAMAKEFTIDPATLAFIKESGDNLGAILEDNRSKAYTKEDIEIGRKYAYAMGEVKDSFNMLAAIGMRVIVPALTKVAEWLEKGIEFLRKHEPFVKAAILGIAAVITYSLLPAIMAIGKGIIAAFLPLWPIIAVVALLVLLIDDFVTYLQGGESQLEELWSVFGTGPEILQALSDAWETMKEVGREALYVLRDAFSAFFGYFEGVWRKIKTLVLGLAQFIKGIFIGDLEMAGQGFEDFILGLWFALADFLMSAMKMLWDGVSSIGKKVAGFVGKGLLNFVTLGNADKVIDIGKSAYNAVTGNSASAAVPTSVATTNNAANSSNTSVQVQKIEINAPNSDPKAIAQQTGNEVRKLANTGNRGVRQ